MLRIRLHHDGERRSPARPQFVLNQLLPNASARRHNSRGRHSIPTIRECLSDTFSRRPKRRSPLRKCGFQKSTPSLIAPQGLSVQPLYQHRLERRIAGRLTCKREASITSPGKLRCQSIGHWIFISFYRNQSSLLAFTVPQKWRPGSGVSIVGTHVDSPNLRVHLFLFDCSS